MEVESKVAGLVVLVLVVMLETSLKPLSVAPLGWWNEEKIPVRHINRVTVTRAIHREG